MIVNNELEEIWKEAFGRKDWWKPRTNTSVMLDIYSAENETGFALATNRSVSA
jgi:hypothetical protein